MKRVSLPFVFGARWAPGLLLGVAAALLACGPSGDPVVPETLEEMVAAVTIHRDSWGVPHVYGPTDASVVFGYMYAQAEDNFWQIEDSIIQALGRSAEINGEAAAPADLLNRALEISRLSKEEWSRTPDAVRRLCEAAADGLNLYADRHPDEVRLISRFEPWHFIAFSRFATYQLFIFGRAGIKPGEMSTMASPLLQAAAVEFPEDWHPLGTGRSGDQLLADANAAAGSNTWAVAPDRTENGNSLLFVNPHQPYFGPGQWTEGHLHSEEGLHFSGAGFFGSLIPSIGHNERLGWSHTVNRPDVIDVYMETFDQPEDPLAYRYGDEYRQAEVWTSAIGVKTDTGVEVREYEFRKTLHGPILGERDGKSLAVRMAMFEEGGQLGARYNMAKAQNLEEFQEAMSTLSTVMFNTMYADADGNIYYLYNGAVPRRSLDYDWSQPVDGSDPGTDWQGYHALSELPQLVNPPAGYLQNCNATPFLASGEGSNQSAADFPPYMAPEEDNPRSRMSRRLLAADSDYTFEEWERDSFDTTIIEAEVWIPRLAEAVKGSAKASSLAEPLAVLQDWDGVSTTDSVAMTLFFTFRDAMITGRIEDPVTALATGVAKLEEGWGSWQVPWGELNRLQRRHTSGAEAFSDEDHSVAVAGAPGPLGVVFNFYTRPQEGAQRRYGVAGHSFVQIVEFGDQPKAKSILVFGADSDPESAHYFDQSEMFAKKQYKPAWFTRAEVEADAQRSYHPGDPAPES